MLIFDAIKNTVSNKNSFLHCVLTLTSGTVMAQAITIVASPVLTRLYSPEEMGVLASLLAVMMILGSIAAGRYDQAIVLPKSEIEATAVAYTGILIAAFSGILVSLIFIWFGDWLGPLLGMKHVPRYWMDLIGLMVFLIGIEQILNRLCIRGRKFKLLASTQVTQQLLANGVKIGLGFAHFGVGGLFIGTLSGNCLRSGRLMRSEWKRFFHRENIHLVPQIKQLAVRYKNFPLVNTWSTLLNTASSQLPVILFASLFSPTVAGFYSLSHRILTLPSTLIGRSVGDVFVERGARTRNKPEELSRVTLEIYKKLLLIGAICMSFVTFYGDILFPFVFGRKWIEAGIYAQWLSIWLVFNLAYSPISTVYNILEHQGEFLLLNVLFLVSRICVFAIGFYLEVSEHIIIILFSIAGALYYLFSSIRVLRIVHIGIVKILFTISSILIPIFSFQYLLSLIIREYL